MKTKIDIASAKRTKVIAQLSPLLADAADLYSQTKQAHWNVKGENFIALHELFDKVAGEINAMTDIIAERIMQLGGSANGTMRVAAKNSRLKEYPLTITDGQKHVDALSTAIAAFAALTRKAIDTTDELGDSVTSDILTGITADLDKNLWFVESHLKG